jgi:hypothetical protein
MDNGIQGKGFLGWHRENVPFKVLPAGINPPLKKIVGGDNSHKR